MKQWVVLFRKWNMGRSIGAKEVPADRRDAIWDLTAVGVKQKNIIQHYSMQQSKVSNIIRRLKDNSGNNQIQNKDCKKELSPKSVWMP